MTDTRIEYQKLYLKPGELCVSQAPVLVTTILGSCVSVTMHHPMSGVAAICHAVQPACTKPPGECPNRCPKRYHYVACVIPEMIHHMEALGAKTEELTVKLFGGGAVLTTSTQQSIGRQNINAARSALDALGLTPKVHQVGGHRGRKLIFNTHTGEVMLKKIRYSEATTTLQPLKREVGR